MTAARILMFPDAIELARLTLVEARLAWKTIQRAEATVENWPAYEAAREGHVAAWAHYRAVTRV